MNVGMSELVRVSARATGATGTILGFGFFAEQELPEPDGETLLPDAAGAVNQETGRKGSPAYRCPESAAKRVVAVQRNDRHA